MIEKLNLRLGQTSPKIQELKGDIGTASLNNIYFNRSEVLRKLLIAVHKREIQTSCLILVLYNPLKPSLHQIICNSKTLHAVLCVKDKIVKNDKILKHYVANKDNIGLSKSYAFLCPNGNYISILNMYDETSDCQEKSLNEANCTCKIGLTIMDKPFCAKKCHPQNCTCSHLYRQNSYGGCQIYWKRKHFYHPLLEYYNFNGNYSTFKCSEHLQIHYSHVNDLIPDCANGSDETFLVDRLPFRKEGTCEDQNMLECYPGHGRCYFPEHQCMYYLSNNTNTLLICRNGKHLENCEKALCTSQFKCPQSYCVPYAYICNGLWDCWNGYDEYKCKLRSCQGLYLCLKSSVCVPLDSVCNGISDCKNSDDEYFCIECSYGCKCLGLAISCKDKVFTIAFNIHDLGLYMFIEMSYSVLIPFNGLFETILLSLAHNKISEFLYVFKHGDYNSLRILYLEFNKIRKIRYSLKNVTFMNLVFLDLSNNKISKIENFAFARFVSIQVIDLSSNKLSALISKEFMGIPKLKVLNLLGNLVLKSKFEAFLIPNGKLILTESIQVCCAIKSLNLFCTESEKFFSSCHTLLNNWCVRIIVWIFGLSSTGLNAISIITSCKIKADNEIKNIYNFIVISLNALGILIGMYLVVLGIVDFIFGENFVNNDLFWRHTWFCKYISIILFSSQMSSCWVVMIMGVARYTGIKYSLLNIITLEMIKRLISIFVLTTFIICNTTIISNFYLTDIHYLQNSLCSMIPDVIMSLPLKMLIGFNSLIMASCFMLSLILYNMLLKYVKCSQESMENFTVYGPIVMFDLLKSNAILTCLSLGISYLPSSLMLLISLFTSKFTAYFQVPIILVFLPISSIMIPLVYNFKCIEALSTWSTTARRRIVQKFNISVKKEVCVVFFILTSATLMLIGFIIT